ncbi:DUF309 domain-containing protein [Paenibacillus allorhizosphaerae]|uniref:DUF309 domain-containing protein n=1 Tax=Paenibacillus allorhizosphaerae TaxID=2849866 RepID=A0ABM8VLK0_9BACL|nr:DUF309 domain-containing protein [Paenibacillus allorhizosphaerae]CAG7648482.1 hypothetical protein PAECIP111802_04221 [Paenibacillus allorhizosphaerae]
MRAYPEAYIQFLAYFHGPRDYFECHEVMEDYWKSNPGHPFRQTLEGLIQAAVSFYHQRRGNLRGGEKMLRSALTHLRDEHLERLGIEAQAFRIRLVNRLAALERADSFEYTDIDIPLSDAMLEKACRESCAAMKAVWLQPSNLTDAFLLDKHKLRDRSEVIAERERQRLQKLRQRTGSRNNEDITRE